MIRGAPAADDEQARRGKTAARRCEQAHAAGPVETRAPAAWNVADASVAEEAEGVWIVHGGKP
jgi:hypothetical protein